MSDVDRRRSRRGRRACFWVSLGEPLANVGITAAERTLTPAEGRGAVSLTLGNYSDSPARRRVTVSAGDKEVLSQGPRRAAGSLLAHASASGRSAGGAGRASDDALAARQRGDAGRAAPANRRRREPLAGRPGPSGAGQGARSGFWRDARRIGPSGVRRGGTAGSSAAAGRVARRVRPGAGGLAREGRAAAISSVRSSWRSAIRCSWGSRSAAWCGQERCRSQPVPCARSCRRETRRSSECLTRRPARGQSRQFSSTSISIAPISFDRPTGRS